MGRWTFFKEIVGLLLPYNGLKLIKDEDTITYLFTENEVKELIEKLTIALNDIKLLRLLDKRNKLNDNAYSNIEDNLAE